MHHVLMRACDLLCRPVVRNTRQRKSMQSQMAPCRAGPPPAKEMAALQVGDTVVIHGLVAKPELNGKSVEVVCEVAETGRLAACCWHHRVAVCALRALGCLAMPGFDS